jgi:glycosyltransferase involved in cell wall biosynthesis
MKICYLCQDIGIPLNGHKGASAHVRGFVRALKLLGHDLLVVTSSSDGDSGIGVPVVSVPRPALLKDIQTHEYQKMVRALSHLCNNVATEQVLKGVNESFQPDLIYERYSPFAVAGSIFARQHDIRHILEVNALLSDEGKRYRGQALQEASEFLEQTAFDRTSLIITVSRELKESLISLGIPSGKIADVLNGVEESFFLPINSSIREKFHNKIVIVFVGSLKPWHAVDLLTDSFRILACDPVYHMLVVGDGPMMKRLKTLKKEFPGRVTLTGNINHHDVPEYIHAMDIAVAPYPDLDKFYFSPLKIFEYMAAGKAVIATGVGQVGELIQHGKTGWLVPPNDPPAFLEAIRKLSRNRALRERLGQEAADNALAYHTWRKRAAQILDLCLNGVS